MAGEIAPDKDEDVPAAHCVQLGAPAEEYKPGAQLTHVAAEVAPIAYEEVPAAQLVHVAFEVAPAADE